MIKEKKTATVKELRKLNLWPFPLWENGKMVITEVKAKRVPKPDWYKEAGPAPF